MTKNIYVFEGGGSEPKPLAVIDMSKYSENDSKATSAILYKKINNVFTLEIDIPTNCDASQSITNTSDLVLYDTENNLQEFHVTELTDLHEYSVVRTVYAEQSISELIEDIITGGVEMPTTTNPADYLAYILSFTRWSVGTVDSGIYNSRWKEDLTGKNCLEALQMFMDKFNCEFTVRYESDNKNRITARYIDIKKTIGNNYGKRFEDTKDINALKRNLDLDSIKTAIYPRIAKQSNDDKGNSVMEYIDISSVEWSVAAGDPVNKPLGQTIIIDPDADTMYKRLNNKTGKLQERIMYAEWSEQTAKDAEDLCSQAWRILKANSVITPSYEVTASDLYRLSGNNSDYAHEQVSLGDICIIIDRKITPELRATTRVVEIEEDLLNPINNKYVFGKYRQTLATSNVDQQKSIEEKLAELSGRIQGMTIPEVKPQYQSGKVYYEDIKQDVQNEFMSSNGYVMAEDSNGFWVMDAPQGGTPTKALILKGGNLAIATYNTVTSTWEVGTFINGTSVNADYINTGHISADVIAAHSITSDHLTASAVQYIRTGMATDEDLQGVIDSVTAIQTDYITSQELNNAIDSVTGGTLTVSQIKAIEDTQRQLKAEYQSLYSQANKIYASEYLPSGSAAKNDLATKINAYTTAYNTYNNQITSMIADNNISDEEYRTYKSNADAYATALKNLTDAMEVANDARLANVYAQAREGMVTTAQLEVNNEQVIASAKQGMVSTADMTDAINFATEDLVSKGEMNTAITEATGNLASATELTNQVASAKIESIKQTYNAIKVEYSNNKKQADTLYANTYLKGTAKSNLNSAISDYSSKFVALTTAYNNIVNTGTFTESQAGAWSTAITNLTTSNTTLAQRMQEANTAINTEITNSANAYAEGIREDVTQDITEVNTAVNTLRTDVNTTIKDGIIEEAEAIAIQSNVAMLNSEKADVDKEYATLYANSNLTGMYKSSLKSNKDAYDTAHASLIKAINDAIADNKVTEEESNNIDGKFTTYNVALANYRDSVVAATDAISANRINNATKNLVDSTTMSNAIDAAVAELPSVTDVESAKNNAIIAANIETIKQTFKSITNEYNSNHKQADTMYKDSYLTGTAKINLSDAINDYNTKYNAVKTAHDDIVNKATLSTAQLNSWNTAVTNMQSSTTNLAQRMQEAQTYINTAIYNASKNYTDQAIPDALTGYATSSYVDKAKADAIADAKKGMVSTAELQVNNKEILMTTASMGQYNLLRNTDFRDKKNFWSERWDTKPQTYYWDVVKDSDIACMSGERAMRIWIDTIANTTLNYWGSFYQGVTLQAGVTYTLSYWINSLRCSAKVSVWNSDFTTEIAGRQYDTPINGGHDRASHKYDSITFTATEDGVYNFIFQVKSATSTELGCGIFVTKPMLCTGINAQAWTAHPDEIYVGVVSITEERGIMVEHSDADSYSTLDSDGLKVWEYGNDSPVASFGEGNTAFIDTVATNKIICDAVRPTIDINSNYYIYFSNTGSGDYTGRDANNCCAGFTGAMATLCRNRGINTTHIHGDFNIRGNGWIYFYGVGTSLDEDIVLQNIYTTAAINIMLPSGMTQTGSFRLINLHGQVTVSGGRSNHDSNDGCMIKRDGQHDGIYIRNCSCVNIEKLRFSNNTKDAAAVSIDIGSNVHVSICDFYQFYWGIFVKGYSTVFINYCRGTSGFSGTVVYDSFVIYNGYIPAGNSTHDVNHDIFMFDCSAKLKGTASDANTVPQYSVQAPAPITSQVVTSSFSATYYQSVRQYTITDLYQAAWDGSGGYGEYVGEIYFGDALKNWLSGATGISAQIYLQRQSSQHGYYSGAKVKINGTDVGSLALGEGKWFNVPSNVCAGLQDGSINHVSLNGTGNAYYCKFEKNVTIKVTATKRI